MKFECESSKIKDAISVAESIAPKKAVAPIVKNISLAAGADGTLDIMATDYGVEIRVRIEEVDVKRAGSALLPAWCAKNLMQTISSRCTFEQGDGSAELTVRSGLDEFVVATEDPADFPNIPEFSERDGIHVVGGDVARMYKRTHFAVAQERGRYAIDGILISAKDQSLRFVAMNGHRLSLSSTTFMGDQKSVFSVVPPGAIKAITGLVGAEDIVSVKEEDARVIFQGEDYVICARCLAGEYPQYENVIPEKSTHQVSVSRLAFSSALKKAALLLSKSSSGILFSFQEGRITIRGATAGIGTVSACVNADYAGEMPDYEVKINHQYINDIVKSMRHAEKINIQTSGKLSPVVICDGDETTHIVMPLTGT